MSKFSMFQLTVNEKNLDQNYVDFQAACEAYQTALDTLCTARAIGARLQMLLVVGPPQERYPISSAVVLAGGMFDTEFSHVEFARDKFYITDPEIAERSELPGLTIP
jgi:hypothetical protein